MREFLEANWGDSEGLATIWHRRRSGKGSPVDAQAWYNYPEEFDLLLADIEELSSKDVYFSPPLYERRKREPGAATMVQSVWCDADTCDPSNFRLPPSRVVQSSPGRWQTFWDLVEPITAAEASELAHKIAIAHRDQGADISSWPANKLMRVPGTTNTNWGEPFTVTVETTGLIYTHIDIEDAYEDIDLTKVAATRSTLVVPENIPQPENLPDFMDLVQRIPSTEKRLNDLIYKKPKDGPDGWRSEHRYALLADLFRFGFDINEVVAVAWNCPAASKWREDGRGVNGLYGEAAKVRAEIELEKGEGVPAAPPMAERAKRNATPNVKLLKPSERTRFEQRQTWDVSYLEWMRGKVPVFNEQYHMANLWVVLSAAFGEIGFIPSDNEPTPLNVYVMILGESSTGKTEAKSGLWQCLVALFPNDNPDIGGNHSDNALIERLLERDGKVSVIHAEEAHGKFKQMAQGGWTTGIQETWTAIYDGKVPQLGRVGRADLQNANARAIPVMHMQGTLDGMLSVLTRDMFTSGYLARQIWAIGRDVPPTRESLEERQVEGDLEIEYEAMPKYWASRFAIIRAQMRARMKVGQTRVPMLMTKQALARMGDAKWEMTQHFDGVGDPGIYRTAIRRMSVTIRKMATLIAMAEGKMYVDTSHVIVALGYAETWLENLVVVADGIAASAFSKSLDDIERFIASKDGQEAEVSKIYTHRGYESKRIVDEYLANLMAQGRVVERQARAGGPRFYKIKEAKGTT